MCHAIIDSPIASKRYVIAENVFLSIFHQIIKFNFIRAEF